MPPQKRGFFITGTDTGVGKTIVAAAIARYLRDRKTRVGVVKPVTSGAIERDGRLISEDAELLRWASGCCSPDSDIAPYVLRHPLAPSKAAELEGVNITLEPIVAVWNRVSASHDMVVVEGAGGLLVPLADDLLVAHLAVQLDLPLFIVVRAGLGTVNHTLMTCECAQARGLTISGIIINGMSPIPDQAEESAARLIEFHSGIPVVAVFGKENTLDELSLIESLARKITTQPLAQLLVEE